MNYAQVVFGISVEGPFDYLIPEEFTGKIYPGMRVWVSFASQKKVGYVVGTSFESWVKNILPVLALIDSHPLISARLLQLSKDIANYYCCSWGEVFEAVLPEELRRGRKINGLTSANSPAQALGLKPADQDIYLLDPASGKRWYRYADEIKAALARKSSAIALFADIDSAWGMKRFLKSQYNIEAGILYRKQPGEILEWLKIRKGEVRVVVGTRSAIFAPLDNPGLIIVDQEHHQTYKQEQVPHYHARDVAIMRSRIENAKLILAGPAPSLEVYYLSRNKLLQIESLDSPGTYPQVKTIPQPYQNKRQGQINIISKYLHDAIEETVNSSGRVLLFLNRKGFSTTAFCQNCGFHLKCPRCSVNLTLHFKDNILNCHYCDFKIPVPRVCPECDKGYIKFSGQGIEKIEKEIMRIFPSTITANLDDKKVARFEKVKIVLATSAILKEQIPGSCGGGASTDLGPIDRAIPQSFDLIAILGSDNSLNRVDFRASEKTYILLRSLLSFAPKKIILETNLPAHYCYNSFAAGDMNSFYEQELVLRGQLSFPPIEHICFIKLRAKLDEKVKSAGEKLFNLLNNSVSPTGIRPVSLAPGNPAQKRGYFYWQIMLQGESPHELSAFIKNNLKSFSHSGIILTVDMDPL